MFITLLLFIKLTLINWYFKSVTDKKNIFSNSLYFLYLLNTIKDY